MGHRGGHSQPAGKGEPSSSVPCWRQPPRKSRASWLLPPQRCWTRQLPREHARKQKAASPAPGGYNPLRSQRGQRRRDSPPTFEVLAASADRPEGLQRFYRHQGEMRPRDLNRLRQHPRCARQLSGHWFAVRQHSKQRRSAFRRPESRYSRRYRP